MSVEWKRSLIESTTSWRQRIQLISSFVPFDGDSLLLTGSFDHCFYHELEVRFEAVSYIGLRLTVSFLLDFQLQLMPSANYTAILILA